MFSYRSGHGGHTNTLEAPLTLRANATAGSRPRPECLRGHVGRVNQRGMLSKASEFICLIYRQTLVSASDQDDCGSLEEEAREGDWEKIEGERTYCFKLGWKNNPALPQLNTVL